MIIIVKENIIDLNIDCKMSNMLNFLNNNSEAIDDLSIYNKMSFMKTNQISIQFAFKIVPLFFCTKCLTLVSYYKCKYKS